MDHLGIFQLKDLLILILSTGDYQPNMTQSTPTAKLGWEWAPATTDPAPFMCGGGVGVLPPPHTHLKKNGGLTASLLISPFIFSNSIINWAGN